MAEALRPGGVYQVGKDRFVNAHGEPVDAPTRKETAEDRKADEQAEQQLQQAAVAQQVAALGGPAVPRRGKE